jgi:Xaa-Pro aminopeptidase
VRIEDDVLITETGVDVLSEAIPRRTEDVEAWVSGARVAV